MFILRGRPGLWKTKDTIMDNRNVYAVIIASELKVSYEVALSVKDFIENEAMIDRWGSSSENKIRKVAKDAYAEYLWLK